MVAKNHKIYEMTLKKSSSKDFFQSLYDLEINNLKDLNLMIAICEQRQQLKHKTYETLLLQTFLPMLYQLKIKVERNPKVYQVDKKITKKIALNEEQIQTLTAIKTLIGFYAERPDCPLETVKEKINGSYHGVPLFTPDTKRMAFAGIMLISALAMIPVSVFVPMAMPIAAGLALNAFRAVTSVIALYNEKKRADELNKASTKIQEFKEDLGGWQTELKQKKEPAPKK